MIRLKMIEQGRGWRPRTLRPILRWLFGQPIPGFVKVLVYRYRLFGKPIGRYGQAVLRGPSRWSVAERELFAALVSAENECEYCVRLHGAIAGRILGACVVEDVTRGRAPDCAGSKVAAMVPFLRCLSRGPEQVAVGDVLALRRAGLDDEHVMQAVHVAVLLEICNRVVNALGVEPMSADQNTRAATYLLHHGYQR